jgi:hypothetical protein
MSDEEKNRNQIKQQNKNCYWYMKLNLFFLAELQAPLLLLLL